MRRIVCVYGGDVSEVLGWVEVGIGGCLFTNVSIGAVRRVRMGGGALKGLASRLGSYPINNNTTTVMRWRS